MLNEAEERSSYSFLQGRPGGIIYLSVPKSDDLAKGLIETIPEGYISNFQDHIEIHPDSQVISGDLEFIFGNSFFYDPTSWGESYDPDTDTHFLLLNLMYNKPCEVEYVKGLPDGVYPEQLIKRVNIEEGKDLLIISVQYLADGIRIRSV